MCTLYADRLAHFSIYVYYISLVHVKTTNGSLLDNLKPSEWSYARVETSQVVLSFSLKVKCTN